MKIEEFVDRARARGVLLKATDRGGFIYLERGDLWIPLTGIRPGVELPAEHVLTLCQFLGLEPEDFELDPE